MSTDSEIIRRSVESPAAFAELFERHSGAVAAFASRRLGTDAAEDVLSETFLTAFRRRDSFDHEWETARPWLFGIATRLVKKHRSAEARHWRAVASSIDRDDHVSDGALEAAATRADASAAIRALAPRIATLAKRDRDTLFLYAWGDLSYEEVSVALGVPVGTVRSRLNRVRRKLAPPGSRSAARLIWIGKEEADGPLGTSS